MVCLSPKDMESRCYSQDDFWRSRPISIDRLLSEVFTKEGDMSSLVQSECPMHSMAVDFRGSSALRSKQTQSSHFSAQRRDSLCQAPRDLVLVGKRREIDSFEKIEERRRAPVDVTVPYSRLSKAIILAARQNKSTFRFSLSGLRSRSAICCACAAIVSSSRSVA